MLLNFFREDGVGRKWRRKQRNKLSQNNDLIATNKQPVSINEEPNNNFEVTVATDRTVLSNIEFADASDKYIAFAEDKVQNTGSYKANMRISKAALINACANVSRLLAAFGNHIVDPGQPNVDIDR